MGQIRQRGAVYWIRYYRDGKRYEESTHSKKEGAAKRLLRLREGAIEQGVPVTPKIGRLKFDDAAKDLITDYRVNGKKSLEHVTRRVDQHLKPTFGGRRMTGITTTDVRAYVDKRQKEAAANASINRELAALKRMFSLAIQAGKLLHRPYIPMLREDNARQGFFERPAFESMRAKLPADVQPIATFAYLTGWRVQSEVLPLTWGQVDRHAGIVRLESGTTKNGDGRVFDYSGLPDLVDLFNDLWTAHEAFAKSEHKIVPWVFNRAGKQIRDFRHAWETATTAAGCPGRIPHDLRRTAVRNLVRAGVPERVAMKVTGHKTRSVFDRYDITSPGDLRDAGAKLYEARNATGTITGTATKTGTA
ncbi:MAG: tyrosine-type recombinase/integrase [Acidobacteria bacterium]|nr:tyrosine-type recombinase/integrase [Acidobacteriota bacterium]